MITRRQQRGLTLIGLMFWGIVLVFVALVAMKLAPAYIEYFEIKKILSDIGGDPALRSMSNADIRKSFSRRAMIDNISTVKAGDLEISRDDGSTVISVEYPFQTRLVGNVSLLVDFSASSQPAQ